VVVIGLPIVARELQRAERRRRTWWLRLIAAVAVVFFFWVESNSLASIGTAASAGRSLFFVLAGCMFVGALASGFILTAPCLREEKETRMLEMLLLTDLRTYHLVLGKLAAHSLAAFQVLFAALPVLAVPLVIGGVSLTEYVRMVALLLATLLLSLSVGLWRAAVCLRARTAMVTALLWLMAMTVGFTALDDLFVRLLGLSGIDRFLLPGPVQAFYLVSELAATTPANSFNPSFGYTLLLATGLLWLTCHQLRRACEGDSLAGWRSASMPVMVDARTVTAGYQARRRALRHNPAAWFARKRRWGLWRDAVMVLALAVAWWGGWRVFGWQNEQTRFVALISTPVLLHALLKMMMSARAAGSMAYMRGTGELELLLVTGLSTRRLQRGFRQSHHRALLVPLLVVVAVDVAVLAVGEGALGQEHQFELWMLTWLMLLMLVAELHVIERVGAWQGLFRPNVLQAVAATVGQTLLLPSILFLSTVPCAPTVYLHWWATGQSAGWIWGAGLWWLCIGSAVGAVYYFQAERHLRDEFRLQASDTPRSLWPDIVLSFRRSVAINRPPGRRRVRTRQSGDGDEASASFQAAPR